MEKEFIPYKLALELKELGFDEPCFTYYYHDSGRIRTGLSIHIHNGWTYKGTKRLETTLAPTFSQGFKWFRKNNIDHSIIPMRVDGWHMYQYVIFTLDEVVETGFDTYEEAELACLTKLIEIVKTK